MNWASGRNSQTRNYLLLKKKYKLCVKRLSEFVAVSYLISGSCVVIVLERLYIHITEKVYFVFHSFL
jgi:hypothetical protein